MSAYAEEIKEAVLDGDDDEARELAQKALAEGDNPEALLDIYIGAIREVGNLWEEGEFFLPELVSGAEAVKAALEILRPALADDSAKSAKVAVIGTVEGDIHDIGKSLVANMLMARGFEVVDLGVDVSAYDFVDAVEKHNASLVGISALLTTTMIAQKTVVEKLEQRGLRNNVKILVGGAPVTKSWADEIGADGTAEDAVSAADTACALVQ